MTDDVTHEEILNKHRNYVDTVSVTVTEHAAIRAKSDLLSVNLDGTHTDLLCGVTVTRDGGNIAIGGGTINDSEMPYIYTYNGLTPEQAREVADGLHEAADEAERLEAEYADDEDGDEKEANSIIKRILS